MALSILQQSYGASWIWLRLYATWEEAIKSGLPANTKPNFGSVVRYSKRILFGFNDSTSWPETFAPPLLDCTVKLVLLKLKTSFF